LGLPLAAAFVKEGYTVHGSTTSAEKMNALSTLGIQPFLLRLYEDRMEGDVQAFLKGVTVLIVNIPPKLRGATGENYERKMQRLHQAIKAAGVPKIIFVSSTSVYGALQGVVTEATPAQPNTESGKQLLASELLFQEDPALETTVVRFGGLIGEDRHPIHHLAGKKELTNGKEYVNLIHLNDCLRILQAIVHHGYWNELFNGVYPHHPSKAAYYALEAAQRDLEPPLYTKNAGKKGKKVEAYQLIHVKKFHFETYIGS
jgi:nucleoside-diphosphate-sugar epimerase